ncbi:MAG: hypothetical protein K8R92_04775 [Planctomycetes bacterium]|nr:hypothetical protein [Planctomycetota bacterium]
MQRDLLAPPKIKPRKYGWIVLGYSALAVIVNGIRAWYDNISVGELLNSSTRIAIVGVAAVLVYRRLHRAFLTTKIDHRQTISLTMLCLAIVACWGALEFALNWGDRIGSVMPWWMLPMMIAGMYFNRRIGNSLHCPKCEYECRYDDPSQVPWECPECGTIWRGRLLRGRRNRSPKRIAAVLVITLAFYFALSPVFYMGYLAPRLPTSLLCGMLYAAPTSSYTAWDELATRPLGDWGTRTMAERVLCLRTGRHDSGQGTEWLEKLEAAGSLPADLLERYYHEGFEADLIVPDRVKVGQEFTVNLRVTRCSRGGRNNLGLFFAGYTVGESSQPVGRRNETQWAFELRPDYFSRHRDVLPQTLVVEQPGEVPVRVEYWLVCLPSFWPQLHWQENGTPTMPKDALWFERVVLEKKISVN